MQRICTIVWSHKGKGGSLLSASDEILTFTSYHMKQDKAMAVALNSYKRKVKLLKSCSPEWKPIPLKEYIQRYHKEMGDKITRS